jgi:hypothetical protein
VGIAPPKGPNMSPTGSSSLPEIDLARIDAWVEKENDRTPPEARDKVRVEAERDARSVTIFECNPPWDPDGGPEWIRLPVARLRYTKSRRSWTLYWSDRNSTFHLYDLIKPTTDVDVLLHEIDRDPTSIFWG